MSGLALRQLWRTAVELAVPVAHLARRLLDGVPSSVDCIETAEQLEAIQFQGCQQQQLVAAGAPGPCAAAAGRIGVPREDVAHLRHLQQHPTGTGPVCKSRSWQALRKECQRLGLSSAGRKQELRVRIVEHWIEVGRLTSDLSCGTFSLLRLVMYFYCIHPCAWEHFPSAQLAWHRLPYPCMRSVVCAFAAA